MSESESDFFKELREKVRRWASGEGKQSRWIDYLLLAPDLFHLLVKLSLDKDVSVASKAKLGFTIAYFISPIDLIPEGVVGPAGYVDDIALAAYVLKSIINDTDPKIVERHWAGDSTLLEVVEHILSVSHEMVGSGLWRKLKGLVD